MSQEKLPSKKVEIKDIMQCLVFSALQKPEDSLFIAYAQQLLHCCTGFIQVVLKWATGNFFMARFLASSEKRKGILTHLSSSYRIGVNSY